MVLGHVLDAQGPQFIRDGAGAAYPPPSTLSLTPASHHYLHQRYVLLNPHHWQAWGVSQDVVYCRAVVQLHPADG
jgi:hypothetical protein